jgi:hypothetical protein
MIMADVLYKDDVPILGSFDRGKGIARGLLESLNLDSVALYSASEGGSSCGFEYADGKEPRHCKQCMSWHPEGNHKGQPMTTTEIEKERAMMTTETELTEQEIREQTLADVRSVLDWLAVHPEIPLPYEFNGSNLGIYAWNDKKEAQIMARAMGTFEKTADENFLTLEKKFGSVVVKALFNRNQVCERVVVATEEVPEQIIPERIEPAYTKEIVEYRCPSLLDDEEQP